MILTILALVCFLGFTVIGYTVLLLVWGVVSVWSFMTSL